MTSSVATTSEVILDGYSLASHLQDRLRFKADRITDMLAKGQVHVAALRARTLADDAQVLANLQGALDYARLAPSYFKDAALRDLADTITLTRGHFGSRG